jgi:protein ImuA
MHRAGRERLIADLKALIAPLEGHSHRRHGALPFEVSAIDDHLPGGLKLGALHEVCEAGAACDYAALAALFTAAILARLPGQALWCLKGRDLFAPALSGVGLTPDRVLFVETWRDMDVLPAMEEGLRHRGPAAVVGEVARLSLTASRRLQLAAEERGVLALVIRRWRATTEHACEPSAAATRWQVSPAPAPALPSPGLGRARWRIELLRAKGAAPRSWILEAPDAKGRLRCPSDLADRSLPAKIRPPRAALG